ncbi:DEAD/DEAH box helicase [Patulibacter minatonensis]|uniref:DEAD/DEAH box helicase n=1 Tax=Patulibacter minatonensis TaxID=298163 RepID=UPI001FE14BBF|nr:DEAD/DEAH box helicase [Patulibacter minatonensis]
MAARPRDPWWPTLEAGREDDRLVREAYEAARPARTAPVPGELHPRLQDALAHRGISELYAHQAQAVALPRTQPFVVTTGTASGKSLAFQLPAIDALLREPRARALFLYPTKALAQDQARSLASFGLPRELRVAIYDGDTPREARKDVRTRANVVLTNPDMLHVGILPRPDLWGEFLARLRVVVVDEAHVYRGVFGSHVANVLRRLRRLTERHEDARLRPAGPAADRAARAMAARDPAAARRAAARRDAGAGDDAPPSPTVTGPRFMLASATIANPVEHVEALTGLEDVALIDEDGAPGTARQIAMWNPPLFDEDDDQHAVAARVRGEPASGTRDDRGGTPEPADAGPADLDHDGPLAIVHPGGDGAESEDESDVDVDAYSQALWDAVGGDGDGTPVDGPDGSDLESPGSNPDVELLDASELIAGRVRRSALTEAGEMLADLAESGTRTICFIRSRKGVEVVAEIAKDQLEERGRMDLARAVVPYRAGYTTGQRHELERKLVDGEVRVVVTTTALELGIDIGELDACVVVTFPGTVASLRQMWGRAGRRGRGLAVYVAGEDALDQYFCRHPDEFLDRPVESAILRHENESIHLPHLLCAAYEAPLDERDAPALGPRWRTHAEELVRRGDLRERGGVFRPVDGNGFPAGDVGLRSASTHRVVIVDGTTGEEIGHVEQDKAPSTVHEGAVYLHQGRQYEVQGLDLESGYAVVEPFAGNWWTEPKREVEVLFDRLLDRREVQTLGGPMRISYGSVTVTDTVLGYQRRRRKTGEVIDLRTIDLPSVSFTTEAVWYEPGHLIHGGVEVAAAMRELYADGDLAAEVAARVAAGDVTVLPSVPGGGAAAAPIGLEPFPTEHVLGALHAAEHAQIAVLPLRAMCDRWDVGGLSTNIHPQTNGPTIIVYEGHVGGVGIAKQAFREFEAWAADAERLLQECPCESGCPSCVQSPKCGNLNEPLHKAAALELLGRLRPRG